MSWSINIFDLELFRVPGRGFGLFFYANKAEKFFWVCFFLLNIPMVDREFVSVSFVYPKVSIMFIEVQIFLVTVRLYDPRRKQGTAHIPSLQNAATTSPNQTVDSQGRIFFGTLVESNSISCDFLIIPLY